MTKYWTDYHGQDEQFWDHEFGKHATCINTLDPNCYKHYKPQEEVVDFFERTMDLFKSLDTYKVHYPPPLTSLTPNPCFELITVCPQFLAAANTLPSTTKTYTYNQIQSALRHARSVNATFQCSHGALDELWYSFDVIGSVQTGIFVPNEPGMLIPYNTGPRK
jgi:ribonuclease T2